ncbi:MAG: GDSL-type esterase/lipase family protein [Kiritimatiellia bacterium]
MISRALLPLALLLAAAPSFAAETRDTWKGYARINFEVDGCKAWIVEPKQPLPGNPWTWCMEFPDAFTERTGVPELLEKGFHHVHIVVGNTHGSPGALKHFDAFYKALQQHGLARKGALIGLSRGGLYAYNWAALNPDKVACIYGDAPVCDFKSWPGGKGKGKGSAGDWSALIKNYGFKDEAEALAYKGNPVDSLAPLAKAGIPLIHVVGDADDVVPVAENTALIEERYKALGGSITVIHKPGVGHHPHGADDTAPLVAFILKHAGDAARDLGNIMPLGDSITHGSGGKSGYRTVLWQQLAAAGFTCKFTGSHDGNSTPENLAAGQARHEGHSGFIIDGRKLYDTPPPRNGLYEHIEEWKQPGGADRILLMIGSNDVNIKYHLAEAPARLDGLVSHLVDAEKGVYPRARLYVASLVPMNTSPDADARVKAYNDAIPGIVEAHRAKGEDVHFVDLHSPLNFSDFPDNLHPNAGGYKKMADAWFKALTH